MGDLLSAIMSGFFMEDRESRATSTEPADCRMSLCKRYVDGIFEKIKASYTQELTDHLNTVDNTSNITFTHKKQAEPSYSLTNPQ